MQTALITWTPELGQIDTPDHCLVQLAYCTDPTGAGIRHPAKHVSGSTGGEEQIVNADSLGTGDLKRKGTILSVVLRL
jgi:hypothetical protein